MGVRYLFRMDDISWDMNYENFARMRDLFFQYDIRPIIGVIPNNEDNHLKLQVGTVSISEDQFWEEMHVLQHEHGWAVALHGYNHVYVTNDSGIFRFRKASEFAGLPFEKQEQKIREGKRILEQNGLTVDAFMAPSQSLDWTTVEALKVNGITAITDGKGIYPYTQRGILFVPVSNVYPMPYRGICGVHTAVFHTNTWDSFRFDRVERFLKTHRGFDTFQNVVRWAEEKENARWRMMNVLARGVQAGESIAVRMLHGAKRAFNYI